VNAAVPSNSPSADEPARIAREKRTVRAMVRIYCRAHHESPEEFCPDCTELLVYAMDRLSRCPTGADKPTCADCTIHCYKSAMRSRIKTVMSYAGPRMIFKHPILAIYHVLDGRRKPPTK